MINKDNSLSGNIILSCKKDGLKTLLADSFADIPYKVVHYGSRLLHEHLEVMLMCYSPGVMDGDRLHMQIDCPARAEMKVFTQSFNKLHPMKKGAGQVLVVHAGKEAMLQYLPQPTIPFRKAIFHAENNIYLKDSSHLIWGDIISGGRIQSGEQFAFTRIHTQTKVFRNRKLIFYDNLMMEPAKQPLQGMLFFQGFTHQGTLLIASPHARALKKELDCILTAQLTDLQYGVTSGANDTLLIRALGESGEAMYGWLKNIAEMCWCFIKSRSHQEKQPAGLVTLPLTQSKKKHA